jgi:hypothetical protein
MSDVKDDDGFIGSSLEIVAAKVAQTCTTFDRPHLNKNFFCSQPLDGRRHLTTSKEAEDAMAIVYP